MTNWPTLEELETQQSPFDSDGTYPFDYRIVVVQRRDDGLFEEQLRTYKILEPLDENQTNTLDAYSVEIGRQFRVASDSETPDMHIMNGEVVEPIALVEVAR